MTRSIWPAALSVFLVVAPAAAEAVAPPYKVFDRMKHTAAEKAKEAAFIRRKVRENPKDTNFMNRKPTDLVLSISTERPEPGACLAIARDLIKTEKFTTQTVRMFFYKAADLNKPASVADYNMEWSRADGFHAGGVGQSYHALDVK